MTKRLKTRRTRNIISFIFLLFATLLLFACETTPNSNIEKIRIEDEPFINEISLEEFDLSDYKIYVHFINGTIEEVALEESMFSSEDLEKLTKPGKHTVTITYEGKKDSFIITLTESVQSIEIDSEQFNGNIKLEEFELSNYQLRVVYSGGTVENINLVDSMLSTNDLNKLKTAGTHTITVNYKGLSTTFNITLVESIKNILVDENQFSEPIDINKFELSDYLLSVYYIDGDIEDIELDKSMLSNSDLDKLNKAGTHTITINYKGKQTTFVVTLTKEENDVPKENIMISVLELNDLHGYIEQDSSGKGGLSNTTYEINKIRNETTYDDVVLIANGDMFQGTAISNTTYGLSVIESMNKMGFDAMGIGNHEFDWGLDKITCYFDGNVENGEANFPLLNANIKVNSTSSILKDEDGQIFEYTIDEKEGVKVGIVSFIGDVSSSINYRFYQPYTILTDVKNIATDLCGDLKEAGADIIVVNIHGGNSSSVNSYNWNNIFAEIKYENEYVVDAIINGHTHTRQYGYIERTNDIRVPVVQAAGNNGSIGRINLSYNYQSGEVVDVYSTHHYPSSSGYDQEVENVVKAYQEIVNSEVYSVAGETVSDRYDLIPWITNALRSAAGADIAIVNRACLRSNGDIVKGKNITINNIYEMVPFNNQIIIVELKGTEIYSFLRSSSIGYSTNLNVNNLRNDSKTYRIAVLDYVYYWDNFPQKDSAIAANLYFTDILIEDVKLRDVFNPLSDPKAYIGNLYD